MKAAKGVEEAAAPFSFLLGATSVPPDRGQSQVLRQDEGEEGSGVQLVGGPGRRFSGKVGEGTRGCREVGHWACGEPQSFC